MLGWLPNSSFGRVTRRPNFGVLHLSYEYIAFSQVPQLVGIREVLIIETILRRYHSCITLLSWYIRHFSYVAMLCSSFEPGEGIILKTS